jgi:hypothetical protein
VAYCCKHDGTAALLLKYALQAHCCQHISGSFFLLWQSRCTGCVDGGTAHMHICPLLLAHSQLNSRAGALAVLAVARCIHAHFEKFSSRIQLEVLNQMLVSSHGASVFMPPLQSKQSRRAGCVGGAPRIHALLVVHYQLNGSAGAQAVLAAAPRIYAHSFWQR